ncbi:MAG: PilZ domain-containing protein [Planctomycetota bacterium]|nr:MAG: PilZ domain-containing protein [Planctomycetota bacterium]
MTDSAASSSNPEDRRRFERTPWRGPLTIRMPAQQFGGQTENLSGMGVLLFSTSELQVEVEIEQPDGTSRKLSGRLVRYNRLSADKAGLAIEFARHEAGLPNDPAAW